MVNAKSRAAQSLLAAALLAVAVAFAPAATAGKGASTKGGGGTSSGGGSSLSLVMVADANGNGLPNWDDTVTFSVHTTATTQPEVKTACSQNGAQVYYHEGGFYAGDPWAPGDQMFVLASYAWTGGAADCTATVFYMNRKLQEVDVTSLGFHVDA
jgi:hypothetical protein